MRGWASRSRPQSLRSARNVGMCEVEPVELAEVAERALARGGASSCRGRCPSARPADNRVVRVLGCRGQQRLELAEHHRPARVGAARHTPTGAWRVQPLVDARRRLPARLGPSPAHGTRFYVTERGVTGVSEAMLVAAPAGSRIANAFQPYARVSERRWRRALVPCAGPVSRCPNAQDR